MYHEATIANLFEVFLYYDYTCKAFGDGLIDLVDWCVRKITRLVGTTAMRAAGSGASLAPVYARRLFVFFMTTSHVR
jgi:hypothetical protein